MIGYLSLILEKIHKVRSIFMSNNVVVLGSINVDTTYHVDRFPQPGETISAVSKSSAQIGRAHV